MLWDRTRGLLNGNADLGKMCEHTLGSLRHFGGMCELLCWVEQSLMRLSLRRTKLNSNAKALQSTDFIS